MAGREELLAAIATGLRKCRVEDAPNPLIREGDVLHISHMVAEEVEALGRMPAHVPEAAQDAPQGDDRGGVASDYTDGITGPFARSNSEAS